MRPSQEQTLKELLTIIPLLVSDKFRRGDKDHNSDIQDMTVEELVNNVSEELLDAIIYCLLSLKKLREVKGYVNNGPLMEGSGLPTGVSGHISKT